MKKKISLWQFIGFTFTSVTGVLLHFLYEWTNESIFIAPFSGVNESIWEHMKLLYFPLLVFALVQNRYFKDIANFWCIKLVGITSGLLIIPTLYYTYNGAIGKSPDWLNITIFFVATALAFLLETALLNNQSFKCKIPRISFVIVILIGILFVLFTFVTPTLPLFKDPITGMYGI